MINGSNYGTVIKAAKFFVVLLSCLTTPLALFAESSVQGNLINAPTKIEKSANIAAGSENKASQFSIALKNSRMSGTVVNSVQSKNAVNVASGKRNVVSQGSVSVSRGKVKGIVSNSVANKSTVNMAVGSGNQAHQSSVVVKSSTVKGIVNNSSKSKNMINAAVGSRNQANQSAIVINNSKINGKLSNSSVGKSQVNMAVGKSNSASQGAIVMGGTKMSGKVVNNATGENTINAAVGFGNEANQSSIVVDGEQDGNGSALTMDQKATGQGLVNLLPAPQVASGQGKKKPTSKKSNKRVQVAKEEKEPMVPEHVPGQVVFLVDNDKAGVASLDRVAKKYHLNVSEKTVLSSLNRIMVVSSTAKDAAEIAEALKKESGVYNSQPNYVFKTMGQEDPLSPMQNLVSMLDLQEVHGRVSGKNITVAVVDTGVELEHQDLRSSIVGYQNFISDSVYQGEIHGTAVAGIIGADKNEYGIVGIAPDVSLLALRACRQVSSKSSMGECFSTSLVRSLDAAITAKADVVNLSLGAHVKDALLSKIIDSGHEKGIIFAAPVGNDPAEENIAFPASHDKVISIAGLDEQGKPLPNKQLASRADAVAPATHLFVTIPGNSYNFTDGTSLASASISGIIALSIEKKKSQKPLCLPIFNSVVPWPKQVFTCIGL